MDKKLDKVLKISVLFGILLAVISISYYFIVRPMINENKLNDCLREGNNKIKMARESGTGNNSDNNVTDRIIDKYNNPVKYQAMKELILRGEEYKKECFRRFPQ